jgi:FlgN protein.
MEQLITRLEEILENETILYSQILNLGNKKTDIIIKGKINELSVLAEQEQDIVSKLSKLELEREKITLTINKELSLPDRERTLSQILSSINSDHAAILSKTQNKLLNIIKQVKRVNDENGKLINNSLEYIEFSINVLSNAANPGNNYNPVGYSDSSTKSSMFDMKL